MKRTLFAFFITCCLLTACNSTKKTTASVPNVSQLEGTWELNYITGPRIAFGGLYPYKKPSIRFDVANNRVNGNTSCNNFNGKLNVAGNKISFTDPLAMTKMMCLDGNGENVFLETLKKVDSWSVLNGNLLILKMDDVTMMRFVKK